MVRVIRTVVFCLLFVMFCGAYAPDALAYKLSASAKRHGSDAMRYAGDQQWSKAQAAAARSGDASVKALSWWMRLRKDGDRLTIEDYQRFFATHPNWPDEERLLKQAERALRHEESNVKVMDWFARRKPLTATGQIRLAEALMAQQGGGVRAKAEATGLLQEAWRDGGLSRNNIRHLISKYKPFLREKDHAERASALIWKDNVSEAEALLPYVGAAQQKLLRARIALKRNESSASKLVEAVPPTLRLDSGLIFDRMMWRHKRKMHDGVRELLLIAPERVPHQALWWPIRKKHLVRLLDEKNYQGAYELLKNHGQIEAGATLADAEWLAGWIAYHHLKRYNAAYGHFYKLYHGVSFPISRSRGAYWAARAAAKHGQPEISRRWYELAGVHQHTYYGQLAHHALKSQKLFALAAPIRVGTVQLRQYLAQEIPAATSVLAQLDQKHFAKKFVLHMVETANSDMERTLATMLGESAAGRKDYGVQASKRALRYGTFIPEVGYPVLKTPRVDGMERAFILAITRQESEFRVRAESHAGARGLMQVLPSTAKMVARKHGLPYSRTKLLRDGYYNMSIGARYMAGLLGQYDGHYILAIASYNAGPGNVRKWIERFGDPRNPRVDPVIWVESIPFYETRNYVQRVLENIQIYRYITSGFVPTPNRLPYDLRLSLPRTR